MAEAENLGFPLPDCVVIVMPEPSRYEQAAIELGYATFNSKLILQGRKSPTRDCGAARLMHQGRAGAG